MTIYDILLCFFTYSFLGWCTEETQMGTYTFAKSVRPHLPICHLDAEQRKQ